MCAAVVSEDPAKTVKNLCRHIVQAIETLSPNREFITIGLSGGSLIKQLSDELPNHKQKLDAHIPKLRFLFCDERFVPLDHDDCTYYGFLKNNFFKNLNIPPENVFPIKADAENVGKCAADYESKMKNLLNSNKGFDILLLGIGPDGHTCSLFPGHKSFIDGSNSQSLVIPVCDSPKPPPQRVTLTLPYINNSSYLFFCAVGENKASMLKKILEDKDLSLPSANVRPASGEGVLKWFIDQAASKDLKI
ncbi:6-phosphogluconolactonase [Brachionus plicatilis]|uniref:6-phosphogluconolactonase n=1 Tax=Brachionus plicatilis TaxID=10195 RepID=A0A3M7QY48_BRAPC|nr:6-phosphogluconolactonase [Brachionus plicatilis]